MLALAFCFCFLLHLSGLCSRPTLPYFCQPIWPHRISFQGSRLLSVRRGFSRLRASPPCLGATPHTPALLIPVLYRQINDPHSSLVCTNFLPWFSAFNELSKTKIPRLIGQECVHLLDGKFSVSAVVEARTPPASRVLE